jgi:predicted ribosomally synthesized peptide with SipW-like signal peptide
VKKIALSLATIAAVCMLAIGATSAYFSSTATITNNTFSTGTLQIRVNGSPTVTGANFAAVAPGDMKVSPVYGIQNYGAPWFGGPSNLTANKLYLKVVNPNDSGSGLWDVVKVKVEVGRLSGVMQYTLYDGLLKNLGTVDLFGGHWSSLIPGSSQDMRYTVYLPETGTDQSYLMGKTLTWDWSVEGRTQ